jgi:hypothetical protein
LGICRGQSWQSIILVVLGRTANTIKFRRRQILSSASPPLPDVLPVSAIIVAWLTYLPRLVEAASAQTYLAAEMKPNVNNTSLQGDRRTSGHATADRNHAGPPRMEVSKDEASKKSSKGGRTLPVGCVTLHWDCFGNP